MLLAAVSFIPHMDHEEGELVLVAEDYLTALVKNGQIHGNFVSGWIDGVYTAYVHVSHRDAHKRDAASQWVRRTEKLVQLQYGTVPQWEIVDDETSLPVPQLSSASFVYLMSHAMHEGSPVWHGQRGTALPMPLLPISDRLKEELYHWAMLCRSYDQIWTMEGPLADAAWQQISDWSSDFYLEGRRLAAELQAQADKPCFIYLWNDFPVTPPATSQPTETSETEAAEDKADSDVVDSLPCPGCGTPWEVDHQQIPSREPFRKFHYRCNSCQIVTHESQVPWEERTCFADSGDAARSDPEASQAVSPDTDDSTPKLTPDENAKASDNSESQ